MSSVVPSRRSPAKFFVLTFALTVPFWLAAALARRLTVALPFGIPPSIFMVVCPLTAALILVGREEGRRGVRRFLQRIFDLRSIKPKIWYVPIVFLLPLIYLLSYAVMRLMGRPLPDWRVSLLTVPIALALFLLLAACEETGWTGYAFEPMEGRSNALTAALVLGVVWALWHIPGDLAADKTFGWIFWQRAYTVALRALIVWLYNNAGKAVPAAIIFHAMDNVSFALFPNMGSHYDPAIVATITAIAAVAVTYLWGPKTLALYRLAWPPSLRPAGTGN